MNTVLIRVTKSCKLYQLDKEEKKYKVEEVNTNHWFTDGTQ